MMNNVNETNTLALGMEERVDREQSDVVLNELNVIDKLSSQNDDLKRQADIDLIELKNQQQNKLSRLIYEMTDNLTLDRETTFRNPAGSQLGSENNSENNFVLTHPVAALDKLKYERMSYVEQILSRVEQLLTLQQGRERDGGRNEQS